MRGVLEYDSAFNHWYVWTEPTWVDRLFFDKTGREILGSGSTREEAMESARQRIASGRAPRWNTHEKIEL